jgi:hypothetical protein
VLDEYEKTLKNRPAWLMETVTTYGVQHALGEGSQRSGGGGCHSVYLRDGDRVDVRYSPDAEWTGSSDKPQPVQPKRGGQRGWRGIINGWYISYSVLAQGRPDSMAMFAPDGTKRRSKVLPALRGLEAFDGYLAEDPEPLLNVLRSAPSVRVREGPEPVDGHPCLALDADSPDHGRYRVWFDPASGYYPRRIVIEKSGDNLWADKRLSDWKNFMPQGSKGPTTAKLFTTTMDSAGLEQAGDVWLPAACRVTTVQQYADGNTKTIAMNCRRTRLELRPDFAALGAFQPDLREGTRLINEENRQISYEWRDGKPVPKVDKAAVEHMDGTATRLRQELKRTGGK